MAMPTKPITIARRAGHVEVLLHGEHDVSTAPSLRAAILKPVQAGTSLIVDLREASFVDSSVLAVLLDASRAASEQRVGFAIVIGEDPASPVHRILDVTGLTTVLPVHARLEAALAAADESPPAM